MRLDQAKITIVAPVHPWDDVRVFKKQAVSLAAAGYKVTLIARASKEMCVGGVNIVPCRGGSSNRFVRFASLLLVAFQSVGIKSDVYHLHNPDTMPLVWILRMLGRKVIYDTHEDFAERILIREWIPSRIRKPVAWLVEHAEKLTAYVSTAAIATQSDVVARLGNKAHLIENPPRVNETLRAEVEERAANIESACALRLVYIGGVSPTRGLFEMVDALPLINICVECRLWLIGPAHELDLEYARERVGWRYVDYMPRLPQEEAFAYVMKSDVGLIYINDVGDHAKTDPNKIYEYMTFSKPFIASDFDKWKKKLGSLNAGEFVSPGSAEKLAAAVIALAEMGAEARYAMGYRGFSYAKDNSWEAEYVKLSRIYEGVM